jgi:hypothetical protein
MPVPASCQQIEPSSHAPMIGSAARRRLPREGWGAKICGAGPAPRCLSRMVAYRGGASSGGGASALVDCVPVCAGAASSVIQWTSGAHRAEGGCWRRAFSLELPVCSRAVLCAQMCARSGALPPPASIQRVNHWFY